MAVTIENGAPSGIPSDGAEARAHIARFTQRIANEALTVEALVDTLKGAKKFIEQAARDYAERFLLELIQNAYDAHPPGSDGTVRLLFDSAEGPWGTLYVANTGSAFTYRDFRSICEIAQSSKRPGQGIGNKGIGFKSVLQVAQWPEIYSASAAGGGGRFDGFCFRFARSQDLVAIAGTQAGAQRLADRLSPYGLPVPIEDQNDTLLALAAAGFASVIRLPMRSAAATEVTRAQLRTVLDDEPPLLLFLDRLARLEVDVREPATGLTAQVLERKVTALDAPAGSPARISEVDLGPAGRYVVAQRHVERDRFRAAIEASIEATLIDEEWRDWEGEAMVGVAVRVGGPAAARDDRLYCYLPMGQEAHSPIAGHVHAPFAVTLARNALVPGTPLNDLLFDVAADLCAGTALHLRGHDAGRAIVPDLVAWQGRHAPRIIRAFDAIERPLISVPVLPVLGSAGWGSFAESFRWPPDDAEPRVLTPGAVAACTGAPILDPAMGPERLDRIEELARQLPDCGMRPSVDVLADWAEAIARDMAAGARNAKAFDPEAWARLYDDLAGFFDRRGAAALRGRALLIDDAFTLHETWGGQDDGRGAATFFPLREIADGEDPTRDVSIPQTLGRHLAYMHAELPWRIFNAQTHRYENRPGRDFLESSQLVRLPRTRDLLERIGKVLARRRDKQLHADALRLVYNLTATRPYTQEPALHALNLRVPTTAGEWLPAARVRFSGAWPTTHGLQLERLLRQAGGVSADLDELGSSLLAPPAAFGFRLDSPEAWVGFLTRVGVADGLWPIDVAASETVLRPGWWWTSGFGDALTLPEADRIRWRPLIESSPVRPNYPYTDYRLAGPVSRLPGAADFERLSTAAKGTYGRLVALGLALWPDDALWIRVERPRPGSAADPLRLPSPAQAFLRTAAWVPVTRPGEPGQEDFRRPADAWHYRDDDLEAQPTFMPLVVSEVRATVDGLPHAAGRLADLGLHIWAERSEAVERLRVLASVFSEPGVPETLVANFRKACERTWALLARTPAQGVRGEVALDDHLVVSRRGRLGLYTTRDDAEPLHILADEDRLVEAVLDALEVPVLRADPRDGATLAALLQGVMPNRVREIRAADIRVLVDGVPIDEQQGQPLVAPGREWLADVVALTLEFKASAFNRQADQRVRRAVDVLRAIRLHGGERADIELEGHLVDLPGHLRRVFALADPTAPRIAFEGDPAALDWRMLESLGPRIGEIIGAVETANALQNVIIDLGRRLGGGLLSEPSDADYSAALEESIERVAQVRRAQRGVVAGTVYLLRPAVFLLLGGDDVLGTVVASDDGPTTVDEVADILEAYDDRWPAGLAAARLVDAATTAASLPELRDALALGYGEFNEALRALAPAYEPIHNVEGHVVAFATYLARHRGEALDALRGAALSAFDRGEVPDQYAASGRELQRAEQRRARSASDSGPALEPDPAWLDTTDLPTDEQLKTRLRAWLEVVGADGGKPREVLEPLDEVRDANTRAVGVFVRRAALAIPAWSRKRGGIDAPSWLRDRSDSVVGTLGLHGILDFRSLTDANLIAWLRRLGFWPAGLPDSLDPDALGLSDADLAAQADEVERQRWERERERRTVHLDGKPVSLESESVAELIEALEASLTDSLLKTSAAPVSLLSLTARKPREQQPGQRWGKAPTRPTSQQTEAIGFMGELVAYAWLAHQYGIGPSGWRSRNRRRRFAADDDPGDDGLGYDFEVLRVHRRPLLFEVKSRTTDDLAFEMGESEIRTAQENAGNDRYRILFVGQVTDSAARWIAVLPNPLGPSGRGMYRVAGRGIRYEFALNDDATTPRRPPKR
jgi:hypothetical protein